MECLCCLSTYWMDALIARLGHFSGILLPKIYLRSLLVLMMMYMLLSTVKKLPISKLNFVFLLATVRWMNLVLWRTRMREIIHPIGLQEILLIQPRLMIPIPLILLTCHLFLKNPLPLFLRVMTSRTLKLCIGSSPGWLCLIVKSAICSCRWWSIASYRGPSNFRRSFSRTTTPGMRILY